MDMEAEHNNQNIQWIMRGKEERSHLLVAKKDLVADWSVEAANSWVTAVGLEAFAVESL